MLGTFKMGTFKMGSFNWIHFVWIHFICCHCLADGFTHPYPGFHIQGSVAHDISVNGNGAGLEEQQDGGAAKGKVALFLTAEHINAGISFVVIYNFPHHKSPYLHHQHCAEGTGAQQGILPGVFFVDRTAAGGLTVWSTPGILR